MVELECIPLGAGHADEGVCLLLKIGPYRVLYDCGLADVRSLTTSPFPTLQHPDWPADFVVCSHAHDDHARGLLALHQACPDLPIYASEVTTHLLPLNWSEVALANFCQPLPWRSPIALAPDLTLELYPAGHLPGAAACLLTYSVPAAVSNAAPQDYTVLYTGDFLLSNARLVDGLPLGELRGLNPDVLILEGSFGTARHPHRRQQETQFAERVLQAIQRGQSVLIPVPILGLGQELLMLMRSHHLFTGKDLDIWVEESIAQGCDAYLQLLAHLPPTVQNFAQHQPLFWDERIRPRVRRLSDQGRSPLTNRPCVILIGNHFPNVPNLSKVWAQPNRPWLVLQPSHRPPEQAAVPPPPEWTLLLQQDNVQLESFLLAEHCDGPGTTQLIHNLRPQHVVFVHGSLTYLSDLTSLDELANRYHLHSPGVGSCLELPVGEGLIQTTPSSNTDAVFEGEVHELENELLVSLPRPLAQDPRWQNFADTGLIEVSWQGEMLVLRGISQRELLMETNRTVDPNFKGCASCRHYRAQRCWNQRSTLYSFKVAPEGYCPVFELEDHVKPTPLQQMQWLVDEAIEG